MYSDFDLLIFHEMIPGSWCVRDLDLELNITIGPLIVTHAFTTYTVSKTRDRDSKQRKLMAATRFNAGGTLLRFGT